jgi:hypothetical protein
MRMMIARRRARAMRVFRMREGSSIAATKAGSVRRLADMAASHVELGSCKTIALEARIAALEQRSER